MSYAEIANLALEDKLQLMEALWDDLCRQASPDILAPAWHAAVVADRLDRLAEGTEPVTDWAAAKVRIRGNTGAA